ncbi:MAG: hypothetical protein CVU39_12665 [Chloroflexi bacterium HGW-Chloroflexi-10]|nr:MAG: hypothetical protein CVU39_12665 [Chloroflexi bacterium HGW-Chloroflexi-10]
MRVLERLDDHRSGWFDDLAVLTHEDGSTSLVGQLVDQSALFGVLEKINRLGLTLISIVQLPES